MTLMLIHIAHLKFPLRFEVSNRPADRLLTITLFALVTRKSRPATLPRLNLQRLLQDLPIRLIREPDVHLKCHD